MTNISVNYRAQYVLVLFLLLYLTIFLTATDKMKASNALYKIIILLEIFVVFQGHFYNIRSGTGDRQTNSTLSGKSTNQFQFRPRY